MKEQLLAAAKSYARAALASAAALYMSGITDPANSDYQRYLNPEAEQSTPPVIE